MLSARMALMCFVWTPACGDMHHNLEPDVLVRVAQCTECAPHLDCVPMGLEGYACVSETMNQGHLVPDALPWPTTDAQPPADAYPQPRRRWRPGRRDAREPIEEFFEG